MCTYTTHIHAYTQESLSSLPAVQILKHFSPFALTLLGRGLAASVRTMYWVSCRQDQGEVCMKKVVLVISLKLHPIS